MLVKHAVFLMILMTSTINVSAEITKSTLKNKALNNGESPYIETMTVHPKENNVIFRFSGDLQLGRRNNVNQENTKLKFDHAINQLILMINNDELEDFSVTITPNDKGSGIMMIPAIGQVSQTGEYVEISIPNKLIKCSPFTIKAFTHSLYYGKNQMLAREGRNLFALENGTLPIITSPTLPRKVNQLLIESVKIKNLDSNSVTLNWRSNHRINGKVVLQASDKSKQIIHQDYYSKSHQITIPALNPNSDYTVILTGADISGKDAPKKTITLKTQPQPVLSDTQGNYWLSVKGKYIVDAQGKPFSLGGYSVYLGEYWYNVFPIMGSLSLMTRYYRSIGFNCCRLGLCGKLSPNHWSASVMRGRDPFELYGGPDGYVKKLVRPLVDQITNEGMYVVIDWHSSYGLTEEKIEQIGKFWEACAKEFKDDPKVAMYQLLNEPCFKDGQNRPDLAPRIRNIMKKYIDNIRKHDKRHIIMVSDWNCGWGAATESQWKPVMFDPGDPSAQIVFSKHVSKEHMTDAFMKSAVDYVADKWDVPLFFDEVESGKLMNSKQAGWFYNFLSQNPRKYGFLVWVAGQYPIDFAQTAGSFTINYLPPAPFSPNGTPIITQWKRLKAHNVSKKKNSKGGDRWYYYYSLPNTFDSGDYGIVVEGAKQGTKIGVVLRDSKNPEKIMGTWLGGPNQALLREFAVKHGQSAVNGATYLHAVKTFKEVIVVSDNDLKNWNEIQLFQLNPEHQMLVPEVKNPYVNVLPLIWKTVTPNVIETISISAADNRKSFKLFIGNELKGAKGALTNNNNEALCLQGNFKDGGAYVAAVYTKSITPIDIDSFSIQVKSDHTSAIVFRFSDSTGQTFQQKKFFQPNGEWQKIQVKSMTKGESFCSWGGANDGKWHSPLKNFSLLLDKNNIKNQKKIANIWINNITIKGKKMIGEK